MTDPEKRLEIAIKRRDALAAKLDRLRQRRDAVAAEIERIRASCRIDPINPDDIDAVRAEMQRRLEAELVEFEVLTRQL